jgi:hypothetical protein
VRFATGVTFAVEDTGIGMISALDFHASLHEVIA